MNNIKKIMLVTGGFIVGAVVANRLTRKAFMKDLGEALEEFRETFLDELKQPRKRGE